MTSPVASRWRPDGGRQAPTGAANRVRDAQAHARKTLALSLVFLFAAPVAAVVPHATGRWLPLHLLLAGGAVLAISAATVLFVVTWSAAAAPGRRWLTTQRTLVALGAAGVAASRTWSWPDAALGVSAGVFMSGLLVLAGLLVTTVRRGVERRFDVATAWYVTAVACGLLAACLGAAMGTGHGGAGFKPAHVALNVLGLVGLVIAGTVPSFTATVGRTKMSKRATLRSHLSLLVWEAAGVAVAALGFATGHPGVAAVGLAMYAAGIVFLATLAPRVTARQRQWAGPRLLAIHAGMAWWAAAVAAGAVQAVRGDAGPSDRALLVLVVGGLVQILWGSLCYLLPVIRANGHEQLSAGFAATRSWTAFAMVNLGAAALAAGVPVVAGVALGAFAAESAVRFARVGFRLPAAAAGAAAAAVPGGAGD